MIPHAPGVQMHPIPEDAIADVSDQEADAIADKQPDKRISILAHDKRIACDEEFSDSEDEGEGGRRDVRTHKRKRPRPEEDSGSKEGGEKGEG